MGNEDIQKHIDAIIEKTFETLKDVYTNQKEPKKTDESKVFTVGGSRIVFPKYSEKYRNGDIRLSEQELRFVFVEQFNEYCNNEKLNWFYSVETPSKYKYIFSGEGITPRRATEDEIKEKKGESASFDLVIYNEHLKRIALIEFKEGNPQKKEFTKDFLKLKDEGKDGISTYFVMYIKSYKDYTPKEDSDTIFNLKGKIFTKEYKDPNTLLRCYVLEPDANKYQRDRIEDYICEYKRPNS